MDEQPSGLDSRESAHRFSMGARIGIAWLRNTCGQCRFCATGRENLCLSPEFTGWSADGGYAEYAVVDEDYAYEIPDVFDDEHAAPLLCAGIIGYRYVSIEKAVTDRATLDIDIQGPLFGIAYKF